MLAPRILLHCSSSQYAPVVHNKRLCALPGQLTDPLADPPSPPPAAAPVLPTAVVRRTIASPADASAIPGLQREFFVPAIVVLRLRASPELDPTHAATLAAAGSAAGGSPPATLEAATHALAADFLPRAVTLANEHIWGNLVAMVYVDSATQSALSTEVTAAVDSLRAGSVTVNRPSFVPYVTTRGIWGGYQDSSTSIAQPGSGVGIVHNYLRFDHPAKAVLWGDFETKLMPSNMRLRPWLAKPLTGLLCGGLRGLGTAWMP